MKKAGIIFAIILSVTVSPFVSAAEPLSDAHLAVIRQNCTEAQATMQRILRSDTASRVNRGRAYEEMIKLIAAFNSRAAYNTYNVPQLIASTANYENEFSAFKTGYISYEESMKSTIKMKCADQPQAFYEALVKTRDLRSALATKIKTMDQLMGDYEKGLIQLGEQLASGEEGN